MSTATETAAVTLEDLLSVEQVLAIAPFTKTFLLRLIREREYNGLDACLVRLGRRSWFFHRVRFEQWLGEHVEVFD